MPTINDGMTSATESEAIYVIEKLRDGRWRYLLTLSGEAAELNARIWLRGKRESKARYRCRMLTGGEDVTARLFTSPERLPVELQNRDIVTAP